MGIFRPTMSSGNNFFGICEISIKKYDDKVFRAKRQRLE